MRSHRLEVRDVDPVHGRAWLSGDPSSGDDSRSTWRNSDPELVGGRGIDKRDTASEPCRDRIGVGDGARIGNGAGIVHGAGAGGAHGVRDDRVGVGDIGEVPCDARSAGDTAVDDDGGGAGRQRDAWVVGGRRRNGPDLSTEPSGDRVGVVDGARGEHGAGDVHGTGSGGAHGMRGDGVGVGDIGEVPWDARSSRNTSGDDDGGGAGRQRDAGVVDGRGGIERDGSTEPSGDRVGVGDGARGEHGACDVHGTGSGGAHGLRGRRSGSRRHR
jgi:hypothetical protein